MNQVEEFSKDPIAFRDKFEGQQKELRKKIVNARGILLNINISDDFIELIARVSRNLNTEGHRSDIAILKTSKTIDAFNNHLYVTEDDLEEAILLVLGELDKTNNKQQIQNAINNAKQDMKQEKEDNRSFGSNKNNGSNNDNNKKDNSGNNDINRDINNNGDKDIDTNNNQDYNDNIEDDNNINNNELDNKNTSNVNNVDNTDNIDNNNVNTNINNNNNNSKGQFRDSKLANVNSDDEGIVNFGQNKYEMVLDSIDSYRGFDIKNLMAIKGKEKDKRCGRHSNSSNYTNKGKYVKSRSATGIFKDIAIDATIRASILNNNNVNANINGNNNSNNLMLIIIMRWVIYTSILRKMT